MLELHLVEPQGTRRLGPLSGVPLLVGRSRTNDVVLDDEGVSGRHLRVWLDGTAVRVRDLGSRNGTVVGDRLVKDGEALLEPGARITVGHAILEVVSTAPSEARRDPVPPALREALSTVPAGAREVLTDGLDHFALASEAMREAIAVVPALYAAGRRSAVLRVLADAARQASGAPVVAAFVWTGAGAVGPAVEGVPQLSASAHHGDVTQLLSLDAVPSSVLAAARRTGAPTWSDDATSDDRFSHRLSVAALALQSVGCVPVGPHGVLYLADPLRSGRFDRAVQQRVEALCTVAAPFLGTVEPTTETLGLPGLVGTSKAMLDVFDAVHAFAAMPWPMLVLGETGTGKERIARAIHELSGRQGPFLAVNCASLSEELALSQIFGHEQGAFTSADKRHLGVLERAGTGTLFLDEIGELSVQVQARLLRVLQEGTFERLGGEKPLPFKARVVAATHRKLLGEDRHLVREDLFHRIAACVVNVPPLRERPDDIGPIAAHVLDRLLAELPPATPRIRLGASAVRLLASRPWPGNVRELENALRLGVARCMSRRRTELLDEHLDAPVAYQAEAVDDLHAATHAFQVRRANEMLEACGHNRAEAARRLGVSRQFLYRLFDKGPEASE